MGTILFSALVIALAIIVITQKVYKYTAFKTKYNFLQWLYVTSMIFIVTLLFLTELQLVIDFFQLLIEK